MTSISQLFERKARAFALGDVEFMARWFVTPTSLYLGEQMIYVADHGALVRVLGKIRTNLDALDYACTRFEGLTQTIIGRRSVRVALDWVNFDRRGDVINGQRTCFYCTRTASGDWSITLVNMLEKPSPALLDGLVLH